MSVKTKRYNNEGKGLKIVVIHESISEQVYIWCIPKGHSWVFHSIFVYSDAEEEDILFSSMNRTDEGQYLTDFMFF